MKQYYAPSYVAVPQPLAQYAPAAPIYRPAPRQPQYGGTNSLTSPMQQFAPMPYPPRQSAPSYNYAPVPPNNNFPPAVPQQVVPQTFAAPPTQLSSPSYESAPANLLAPPPPPSFSAPTPFAPSAPPVYSANSAMQPSYQTQPMQYSNPQNYASAPMMQPQQTASYSSYGGPAASPPSCGSSNNSPPVDNSPEMQSAPIYGVPPTSQQYSSPAISSSEPLAMESAPAAAPPRQPDSTSTDYLLPILYSAASPQLPNASPNYESAPSQQTYNGNSYGNQ